jgi:hypothetical protein
MGIYTNGSIYGIRIYTYDAVNDSSVTLFTKKYEKIMTKDQLREVYLFYKELHIKTDIHFQIYTECTSTHELRTYEIQHRNFMTWYPISLSFFLENFNSN